MAVEQAFNATVEMSFKYVASDNSDGSTTKIEPERISYIVIDHEYENKNILPIIYVSVRVDSDMYSDIMNTVETSKFILKVRKRNALSNSSAFTEVVNGEFSYVTSTGNANYTASLNDMAPDGMAYKGITVGLVSSASTNTLRKNFNGIYKDIDTEGLIRMATQDLPNFVMEPLTYNKKYSSILIPPLTSIYKFLTYLFNKDPFYDSVFTLYMDFNSTYLVSSHAQEVAGTDGTPTNVFIYVKDYTAAEAYTEGFYEKNGAYVVYVNASDTNMIINNATEKIANTLVGYSDDGQEQNLTVNMNRSADTTDKTTFLRSRNVAALKNQLQTDAVTIEISKKNLDPDIFTPNKVYQVSNYEEYDKYDGRYVLSFKKEMYYQTAGKGQFVMTASVGLKKVEEEEKAGSVSDSTSTARSTGRGTYSLKRQSSKISNQTTPATRTIQ